ncbi:uncharacterized protein LOC120294407 [Eucalyptus grandis]|uniref:uncharacterized protein LOC120294407 n=1 Tax=Eucalyptus grandis TaxID=71139 RepID=UPI00192EBB08|nr:uncharacterized protein LOC120294407 [Eucalyptus grandis]
MDPHIYSSGLSRQALVANLFSKDRQAIRSEIESWGSPLPSLSGTQDRFCWREDSTGLFSVASAWEALRRKKARVNWHCLIWSNAILPRYQLNLWLITKRRLPTQSLLMSYGRIDAASYPFCNKATRCNLPWTNRTWEETLSWAITLLVGKDFYKCVARFSFGALCHIIWRNKNNILFRGEPLSISAMKKHLLKVVKDKALTFKNVEDSPRIRRMQHSWDVDPIIFASSERSLT